MIIERVISEKKIRLLIKKIKIVRNKRNTTFERGLSL
jgi:hypothetical protein